MLEPSGPSGPGALPPRAPPAVGVRGQGHVQDPRAQVLKWRTRRAVSLDLVVSDSAQFGVGCLLQLGGVNSGGHSGFL